MGKFTPKVVQCYNRGWDGQDVQVWSEQQKILAAELDNNVENAFSGSVKPTWTTCFDSATSRSCVRVTITLMTRTSCKDPVAWNTLWITPWKVGSQVSCR